MKILPIVLAPVLFTLATARFTEAAERAPSPSPELVSFFKGLEDRWEGTGVERELQADGSWKQTEIEMEVDVDSERGNTWRARSEVKTEDHVTRYNDALFEIRGELLYISTVGPYDPIAPVVSTPTQLSYCFRRSEIYTGRVFTICEDFRIATGRHLFGRVTIEVNGARIQESNYQLLRR